MQGDAFAWSLGLVSRILVRTIDEGSTLVMTLSTSCSENFRVCISECRLCDMCHLYLAVAKKRLRSERERERYSVGNNRILPKSSVQVRCVPSCT